jgi:chemotaxis protein methyltransferase CheR
MRAGPEIRPVVRFLQLNLHAESYAVGDGIDLIFCRNVLIYFDAASRAGVVGRLLSRLAEGGMLFLGHAESLNGTAVQARSVIPTVYARSV